MLRTSVLAAVAAAACGSYAQELLHIIPAWEGETNALIWQAQAACGRPLRLSHHPAWDARKQQQNWYATVFGMDQCAGAEMGAAWQSRTELMVSNDATYFWVSQSAVALDRDQDACPWYARLYHALQGGDTFGLDVSCQEQSAGLTFQRRAQGAQVCLTFSTPYKWGDHAGAHIDRFLPYDTQVARIQPLLNDSDLSVDKIKAVVKTLSGEDQRAIVAQGFKEWHTRHSGTWGARHAAEWIKDDVERSLVSLPGSKCELWEYNTYYAPNVVCSMPAAPTEEHEAGTEDEKEGAVLISAHYDSRGTFGELTAPGADDDGSGTTALIVLARVLGNFGARFRRPVQLVFFSGEEQGLLGSQAYAAYLKEHGAKLHLQFQLDMLAYRVEGEPRQIAFPDKLSTSSVTQHVVAVTQVYVPELVPGYTPACCSDHQSFWEAGFPASWAFEHNGAIRDPFYHNSGDVAERRGYDVVQLQLITKVVLATVLTRAGFYL